MTSMPTDALEVRETNPVAMEIANSSWAWVPKGAEEEVTCGQSILHHFLDLFMFDVLAIRSLKQV